MQFIIRSESSVFYQQSIFPLPFQSFCSEPRHKRLFPNIGAIWETKGIFVNFPTIAWKQLSILVLNYYFIFATQEFKVMAKGPEKNTKNKALHTKLLNRKKAKIQQEKKEKALRLKALVAKINQQKNSDEADIK